MSKHLRLMADGPAAYTVHYENGAFLGMFLRKEDGYFDWWPDAGGEPKRGGYWSAYILREIADTLDGLNAPWDKEINDYFNKQET